jgi:hypothetical protein
LANAKACSWFRPCRGLNQPQTLERVECPERSRGAICKKIKNQEARIMN